jgi:thiol-disulfide isomerase/thioredoxin
MRRALPFAAIAALVAVLAVGLSQSGGGSDPEPAERFSLEQARQRLAGAPPQLADVHERSNQILDGGLAAFRAELRALRGTPVVINKWASWCGPCRVEFPHFQKVATDRGKAVAFLGLNTADNRGDAAQFLSEYPVPFPSFADPDAKIARDLGIERNFPTTLFLDERGEVAFVHQGQYQRAADLTAEIDRYLG